MIKPGKAKFLSALAAMAMGLAWQQRVHQNATAPNNRAPIEKKELANNQLRTLPAATSPSKLEQDAGDANHSIADAQALIDQGLTSEGILALEKLIQRDPTNTQAMMELAMAYTLDRKDPGAARPVLERILDINPNHRAALNELDVVYRELGTTDEGIEFLRLKSQQNPQSLELQFACGKLLADKSPEEALPWLENSLAITDLREDALDQLAMAAFRTGQKERARKAWNEALSLAEQNLERAKQNNEGGIDFLEDRVASARSQVAKATKL